MSVIFINLSIFLFLLFLVIKSADFATHYSTLLAKSFRISKYILGFIVVAVISILPETFISISSALQGVPSLGLGTLFGSNVADLTLVFVIIIFVAKEEIKVESKILTNRFLYIAVMAVPLIFGFNGYYSRIEGLILITLGALLHFWLVYKEKSKKQSARKIKRPFSIKEFILLLIFLAVLIIASHYTVVFGIEIASNFHLNPTFIGMFMVGIGTTLPELMFSLRALKKHQDGLAVGDILGTVASDATIVVGIIALINPFFFNPKIIYVTGVFMFVAVVMLFSFMNTGKKISKKEALVLIIFYLLFMLTEYIALEW